MGELERNMRDDVGQPQGNAPSTDNGGQLDMFEDERERVSHRRGAIARGVAKRGLVAFLAFAMAFGTTPAQLWAEGAEGIAEAVAQAATPGEDAALAGGTAEQSGAEVSDSEGAPAASAAITEAATGDEGSATGESPATSEQSSTASAGQAGSAAAAAVQTENPTETGDVAKKQVEVSFSIIGTDADGKAQTWVAPTQLKLDEGATAADAFIKLQEKTGFKAKYEPNTAYGSTSKASHPRVMVARLPTIRRLMPSGSCSSTARLPRLARAASSSPRGRRLSLPIRLVARPLSLRTRLPQM